VNILSSRRATACGVCEAAEAPVVHDSMARKHSNAAATERIDSEVMRFMVNIYCRKEDRGTNVHKIRQSAKAVFEKKSLILYLQKQ